MPAAAATPFSVVFLGGNGGDGGRTRRKMMMATQVEDEYPFLFSRSPSPSPSALSFVSNNSAGGGSGRYPAPAFQLDYYLPSHLHQQLPHQPLHHHHQQQLPAGFPSSSSLFLLDSSPLPPAAAPIDFVRTASASSLTNTTNNRSRAASLKSFRSVGGGGVGGGLSSSPNYVFQQPPAAPSQRPAAAASPLKPDSATTSSLPPISPKRSADTATDQRPSPVRSPVRSPTSPQFTPSPAFPTPFVPARGEKHSSTAGASNIRIIRIDSPPSSPKLAKLDNFSYDYSHTSAAAAGAQGLRSANNDTLFLSSPTGSPSSSFGRSWNAGLFGDLGSFSRQPSPKELLFEHLNARGFICNDISSNPGDCLFETLADQTFGNASRHRELRGVIADEIAENPDIYRSDIVANYFADVSDESDAPADAVDQYVAKIRQQGAVGDAICIAAYTRVFNCDVAVYLVDRRPDGSSRLACFVIEAPRDAVAASSKHRRQQSLGATFATDEDIRAQELAASGGTGGERVVKNIGWYPNDVGVESANHYISVYPPPGVDFTNDK